MRPNARLQRIRVARCARPGSRLTRHPSGGPENRRPSGPRVAAVLLSIVAVVSCRNSKPSAGIVTDDGTARSKVEATTEAFHQALRTNDADALFAYVSDDVVMMPPGEAVISGKAAMRAWYAGFLSQYRTSALILTNREVFVGGDWATEVGTYEWSLDSAAGGDPVVDHGHYMQLWKRQPDGSWRFAREIWNSSAPALPGK